MLRRLASESRPISSSHQGETGKPVPLALPRKEEADRCLCCHRNQNQVPLPCGVYLDDCAFGDRGNRITKFGPKARLHASRDQLIVRQ